MADLTPSYRISDFLNEFDKAYSIVRINEEVFKIKNINKVQENLIYKNYDIFSTDMTTFIPTMYALLSINETVRQELIDKFERALGEELKDIKFSSEADRIKTLEIKAANKIFAFIVNEAAIVQNSINVILTEMMQGTKDFMNEGDFFQLFPFILVLKDIGYKMSDIRKMSSKDIIRNCFEEIVFSKDPMYLVHVCNDIDKNYNIDVSILFDLFKTFNKDSEEKIMEALALYNTKLNVNGHNLEKSQDKASARTMVVDGEEINLDERDAVRALLGIN